MAAGGGGERKRTVETNGMKSVLPLSSAQPKANRYGGSCMRSGTVGDAGLVEDMAFSVQERSLTVPERMNVACANEWQERGYYPAPNNIGYDQKAP